MLFTIQVIFVCIASYLGFMSLLAASDITKLSFFAIFLWFTTSLTIGQRAYLSKKSKIWQDWIPEICLTLGLIGTIIGLIFVFKNFGTIDTSNVENVKLIISSMAQGISTAHFTTLIGLVTSIFIKIQLLVINNEAT